MGVTMNKKEIIKQLEKIQSLMLAEIFYVDDDVLDYKIRYRDDDIESYYNNDDMYNGITKAIKLLKGGK
tara:strand:+ start:5853 stop:6059 length:207 start_codon:yes stop_codon:yes gene_type:complete